MNRILILLIPAVLIACSGPEKKSILQIRQNPDSAAVQTLRIEKETPVQLAEGLTIKLWATDSLAPDPIAMSVDDLGNIYLTSTDRQKHSEFDIRGYREWMIPSISFQTVEDRRAFLRKTFAPERSNENKWLSDLNGDGSHDWRDLTVEMDEVWKLTDEDGDGRADVSTRIVKDFHEEVTDVAEGLLVREKDLFIGIGPDLWRLQDKDGDGIPEHKESISHGYAVHIGFGGHGMSGIVEGPDGKIYWGIGDIGANITAKDGSKHEYPNEGIIVRSNPDGSDFEVFAAGLRNTHEFVFDVYGNLITSDNDGDHPGESERLMHIVEGADIGWRANWQYGKYTDPKNNGYNVWMDERFYQPRWEGQAAHILPPIMNFHNGPTGMVYNPGTALGKKWLDRFFLVEFVGTPTRSHIWSFTLKPEGATFKLNEEIDMLSGILPTGIRFGPDGSLYVADWINGWDTKDYGRVWKIDVAEGEDDLKYERKTTEGLMRADYTAMDISKLASLLSYMDMRIRMKAQFELVRRGETGYNTLVAVAKEDPNPLGRIHGIWGIGQFAAKDRKKAATLSGLLDDRNAEIIAQAAKVIGDVRDPSGEKKLIGLLKHNSYRVKLYAAQALGRIRSAASVPALISMLDENADSDHYLRHAGVTALARIGAEQQAAELAGHTKRHMRIAGVLILRRLKSEKLKLYLNDPDEFILTEVARAIHDDKSIPSLLPDLAFLLADPEISGEPLLRRAISAAQRAGGEKELDLLIDFAGRKETSKVLRAEAMAALGTWAEPSLVDRVDGYYRGPVKRDPEPVRKKISTVVSAWLEEKEPEIILAAAGMLRETGLSGFNEKLAEVAVSSTNTQVRATLIKELSILGYQDMEKLIERGLKDNDPEVRTSAIGLLNTVSLSQEKLSAVTEPVFRKGTMGEQQQLLRVLNELEPSRTESILISIGKQIAEKKLSTGILLEWSQAVDSLHSAPLRDLSVKLTGAEDGTLLGGNAAAGEGYFFWNSTGQCARCHMIGTEGGKVGPPLTYIGDVLSRSQIHEALMNPGARIAPGYGTVTVSMKDGAEITGVLLEEDEKMLVLKTRNAEPLKINTDRIASRKNAPSGMPAMGMAMSKEELRNLIEFLATRKKGL